MGGAAAGIIGAIVGLIIGLRVYAPTALFALVELGLPAALAGALLGAAVGALLAVRRRTVPKRAHPPDLDGVGGRGPTAG